MPTKKAAKRKSAEAKAATKKSRDLDRRWKDFDSDQFHRISELVLLADQLKLGPSSTLGQDITQATIKEIAEGPNTKMEGFDKAALDTHPILSHILVYARGLRLGPESTLARDVELAVAMAIGDYRVDQASGQELVPDLSLAMRVDTPKTSESATEDSSDEDSSEETEDAVDGKPTNASGPASEDPIEGTEDAVDSKPKNASGPASEESSEGTGDAVDNKPKNASGSASEDSSEETEDAVDSEPKGKRNYFQEIEEIAGDAEF
ncbi:hypothetical protein V494_00919 [Pseudogymnoascus sp. VKM F-4513 (FW-928)]|nr:hypothetical protein V494_00919 [Pseudogymnoascus sp. VKM F-4513 (FW-928)]